MKASKQKVSVDAVMYVVVAVAIDEKGAVNEIFQFSFPRDGDSTFRTRTDNTDLMRELLISAVDAVDYAEKSLSMRKENLQ